MDSPVNPQTPTNPWKIFGVVMLLLLAAAIGVLIYFGFEAYGPRGVPCRCDPDELAVCENDKITCRPATDVCGVRPNDFCPEGQPVCIQNRPLGTTGTWRCVVSPRSAINYFENQVCGERPAECNGNLVCVIDSSHRGSWQCQTEAKTRE